MVHGINQHFGLIRLPTAFTLFVYYIVVALATGYVMRILTRERTRAAAGAFVFLFVFFLFGALHDLWKQIAGKNLFTSYSVVLPITFLVLGATFIFLRLSSRTFPRFTYFLQILTIVLLSVETLHIIKQAVENKRAEFGDPTHELIRSVHLSDSIRRPHVFWIVMDEYAGTASLKKVWNFVNPLDSALRARGFFVADSAKSSYNYTHYSLVSTLDMVYLPGLQNNTVITYRDIVKGTRSIERTNTTELLKKAGYTFRNFTIYDIHNNPTLSREEFADADYRLIHSQTLPGRIQQDVGWNFRNIFSRNPGAALKMEIAKNHNLEANHRREQLSQLAKAAREARADATPTFFMLHSMLTHEPFLYRSDGSIDETADFVVHKEKYIPAINHANRQLLPLIDSLQQMFKDEEYVIVLQGDHGYKFDENDPLFETESCSIYYAVYCSDGEYRLWLNEFNSVNGFRVLFNKYFDTAFPLLENSTYHLYYR